MTKSNQSIILDKLILKVYTEHNADAGVEVWHVRGAIYDNAVRGEWSKRVDRPFYENAHTAHIQEAINLCRSIIKGSVRLVDVLEKSKLYRGD